MTEIPNIPFDKIAIDLVTECETTTSGDKHILTIIDHLTRWPEAFPIPDKSADTIVSTFFYTFYFYISYTIFIHWNYTLDFMLELYTGTFHRNFIGSHLIF